MNQLSLQASVQLKATGETKRLTIEAYRGGQMFPVVNGEPSKTPIIIDIATMKAGSVDILLDHDADRKVGTGNAAKGESILMVAAELDPFSADTQELVAAHKTKSGKYRQASVGGKFDRSDVQTIAAGQTITANGSQVTVERETKLIRNFQLSEVSVLDKGADSTSLSLVAKAPNQMTTETQTNDTDRILELLDSDDAQHLEARDIAELQAAAADGTLTLEAADRRIRLGAKLADLKAKTGGAGPMRRQARPGESTTSVLTAAMLQRTGQHELAEKDYSEQVLEAAEGLAQGSLLQMFAYALRAEGKPVPRNQNDLIASGTSTLSLPQALSDSANKSLLDQFMSHPQTWRAICKIESARNFLPQKSIRPFSVSGLKRLGKDGEIKHADLDENLFEFATDTSAAMFSMTRKDIINDDLALFAQVPVLLGRSAALSVSDDAFETLLAGVGTFFTAGNNNRITNTLTPDGLALAMTAMRTMREGKRALDLVPRTLVVPPELEFEALSILESMGLDRTASTVDRAPTGNPLYQKLDLQVEQRLSLPSNPNASAARWFLFSDVQNAAINMTFLNGMQSPTTSTADMEFNKLGIQTRIHYDFKANLQEPRAAICGGA